MNTFYTYILFSKSIGKYYTGSTDNINHRLSRHNNSKVKSTKYGVPWQLVWKKEFYSRSEAMKLETKIKKRGASRFLKDLGTKRL